VRAEGVARGPSFCLFHLRVCQRLQSTKALEREGENERESARESERARARE
jgi:hypothetical protein